MSRLPTGLNRQVTFRLLYAWLISGANQTTERVRRMTGKLIREDWEKSVRENRRIQQEWSDQLPDGCFVDADIKENLTGKPKRPDPVLKPRRSSLG